MNLEIFANSTALVERAAEIFAESAGQAIQQRGRFSVALSGGSTPRALYERLTRAPLDWQAIHLFWGDERCVPPEHPDSNYRMTAESLLKYIPIPPENVHRAPGELPPAQAAEGYEQELRAFFGDFPRFDLVLLGMGDDGHTASLFPGSPALAESTRWAIAAEHDAPPPPLVARVTLTFGVFNAARRVIFLVSGAGKAQRLMEIQRGGSALPAARIQPVGGELLWLVDSSAAAQL
ncbi:MAG: 6-phosphogluconolactonase [Anaerolineales bacterium]